jgi:hypothetical protein
MSFSFRSFSSTTRAALVALTAVVGLGVTAASADVGRVVINVIKGGWIIGGSGGSGVLVFRGQTYGLSIGGLSGGLVFGAAQTNLQGTVSNIRRASDVTGVYGAVGAGGAIGVGASAITLQNEKGAILTLSGKQIGLMVNLDLSGLAISLK